MKGKRIWFDPDCVGWLLNGKKTTTFRARKHEGVEGEHHEI